MHYSSRLPGRSLRALAALSILAGLALAGCQDPAVLSNSPGRVKAVYNKETGKLEQLIYDSKGDGTVDTRAVMDGVHVKSVEIDRNHDGKPDRFEYYAPLATPGAGGRRSEFDNRSVLMRAEEANGATDRITRKEFYERGVMARVEEDSDSDGRIDTWHYYVDGTLMRVDVDLDGRGSPGRRLVYRKDGSLDHMEVDPAGDGHFRVATPGEIASAPRGGVGRGASGRKGGTQ